MRLKALVKLLFKAHYFFDLWSIKTDQGKHIYQKRSTTVGAMLRAESLCFFVRGVVV